MPEPETRLGVWAFASRRRTSPTAAARSEARRRSTHSYIWRDGASSGVVASHATQRNVPRGAHLTTLSVGADARRSLLWDVGSSLSCDPSLKCSIILVR